MLLNAAPINAAIVTGSGTHQTSRATQAATGEHINVATESRFFDFTAGVEFNRSLLASDFPDLQTFGAPFIWQHSTLDRLVAENNGSGLLSIARFNGALGSSLLRSIVSVWGSSSAYAQVGPALVDAQGNGYWLRLSNLQRAIISRLDYNSGDGLIYYTTIATVETTGSYGDASDFELLVDPATDTVTGKRNGSTIITASDGTWSEGLTPGFAAQQGGSTRDRGIYTLTVPNALVATGPATITGTAAHQAARATQTSTGQVISALQTVARFNQLMRGFDGTNSSGAKRGYIARVPFTIAGNDVTRLVLSFSNAQLNNTGTALSSPGNTLPIQEVALEYDGATVPVLFGGGRAVTLADGEVDRHADDILPAAFGLATFTPGQQLFARVRILHPPGVSGYTPFAERWTAGNPGAQFLLYDPAATSASSVDAAGEFVLTGGTPTSQTRGYSPILLGEFVGREGVAIGFRGDSISAGEQDSQTVPGMPGWIGRMVAMFDTPPATLQMNRSGIKSGVAIDDARLIRFYRYVNTAVVMLGTNDFGTSGTDATAAAVYANVEKIRQQFAAAGASPTFLAKIPARTTSTDGWATVGGQTVTGSGWSSATTHARAYSLDMAATPAHNFDHILDNAPVLNVPDGLYWQAPGYTPDGVHPGPIGYEAMAISGAETLAANVDGLALATGTEHTGTAAHNAIRATGSGTGERAVTGSSTKQAQTATQTATGERVVTGTAAHTAGPASAAGVVTKTVTGTAEHQAARATHAATGAGQRIGTATHQAARASVSGVGERVVVGSGSSQAARATGSGAGLRVVAGTATHTARTATHTGTGERAVAGTANHAAGPASIFASVGRASVGTATHQAARATHTADGMTVAPGTILLQAARATHTGTGEREVVGSATHQAGPATGPRIIFTNTRVRVVRPRYLAMVV